MIMVGPFLGAHKSFLSILWQKIVLVYFCYLQTIEYCRLNIEDF